MAVGVNSADGSNNSVSVPVSTSLAVAAVYATVNGPVSAPAKHEVDVVVILEAVIVPVLVIALAPIATVPAKVAPARRAYCASVEPPSAKSFPVAAEYGDTTGN